MTSLYAAAAVMAFLSGTRALVRLYREHSLILAASVLCMLASGTALTLVALNPALLQARPTDPVATSVSSVLGLVAAWAFLAVLSAVTGEKAPTGMHCVILGGLAQAVLFAAALSPEHPAMAADLFLPVSYCPPLGGIGALAWRCSRHIPVRHIEAGMQAIAAAAVAELVLIFARLMEVILALYKGSAAGQEMTAIGMAQGVAAIQFVAGATIPAWFPVAMSASRKCRIWVAWYRLRPLWVLLLRAAPDVHLPAQPGTRLRACYCLHRRVIEIRDAELALRPFRDSLAVREAADAARSAGLPTDELDAVIEAVIIVTALDTLLGEVQPRAGPHAECVVSEPRNDLESEVGRLLLVSRAVRHSPIVRQVAQAAKNRSMASRRPTWTQAD